MALFVLVLVSFSLHSSDDDSFGFDGEFDRNGDTMSISSSSSQQSRNKTTLSLKEQLAAQDELFEAMKDNPDFNIDEQMHQALKEKIESIDPKLIDAIQSAADIVSGRKKVGALFDKVGNFEKALRDAQLPTDLIKVIQKNKNLGLKDKALEIEVLKRQALREIMYQAQRATIKSYDLLYDFRKLSLADLKNAGVDEDLATEIDTKIRHYELRKNNDKTGYILDRSGVPMSEEERREKQRKADEEAEARDNAERDHIYEHSR